MNVSSAQQLFFTCLKTIKNSEQKPCNIYKSSFNKKPPTLRFSPTAQSQDKRAVQQGTSLELEILIRCISHRAILLYLLSLLPIGYTTLYTLLLLGVLLAAASLCFEAPSCLIKEDRGGGHTMWSV